MSTANKRISKRKVAKELALKRALLRHTELDKLEEIGENSAELTSNVQLSENSTSQGSSNSGRSEAMGTASDISSDSCSGMKDIAKPLKETQQVKQKPNPKRFQERVKHIFDKHKVPQDAQDEFYEIIRGFQPELLK